MLAFAKASGVQPRDETKWGTYDRTDRLADFAVEDGETLQRQAVLEAARTYIRDVPKRTGIPTSADKINVGGVLSAPGGGKSHILDVLSEQTTADVGLPVGTELLPLKITFGGQLDLTSERVQVHQVRYFAA